MGRRWRDPRTLGRHVFLDMALHEEVARMAVNLVASTRLSDFANFGLDALSNHDDR